ncbi:hypothetical protein B0T18DRAFT_327702 [Schizothecium vesticola]|uniref:Distal membrane-arm assembly complex protein 1-like domain-containing protein n=1 Tax=Schizothecium vesticola TaxID=314040 RepID=A0AA40EP29_9PEZI|nr:hypothetical protein B0T18DRAFT_327702 [Schizothecium vesticola]
MAGDKIPSIRTLDKPEDYRTLLKEEVDDCFPCKLVGGGAFLGLGAYSYFSGHSQLEKQQARIIASKSMMGMKSRRLAINGISLGLGVLGLWRLAN